MTLQTRLGSALLVFALIGITPSFGAPTIALSFSSVIPAGSSLASFGWTFSTSQALVVSALGAYDIVPGGNSPAQIGIWDSGGDLLTTATATETDPITDGFNFASIAPISLPVGTYAIAVFYGPNGGQAGFMPTDLTTAPGVTYVSGLFQNSSMLQEPDGDDRFGHGLDPAFFGPNFLESASPAPEPSTLPMTGFAVLALTLLFGLRRARTSMKTYSL
jgi:hypothetical protein